MTDEHRDLVLGLPEQALAQKRGCGPQLSRPVCLDRTRIAVQPVLDSHSHSLCCESNAGGSAFREWTCMRGEKQTRNRPRPLLSSTPVSTRLPGRTPEPPVLGDVAFPPEHNHNPGYLRWRARAVRVGFLHAGAFQKHRIVTDGGLLVDATVCHMIVVSVVVS